MATTVDCTTFARFHHFAALSPENQAAAQLLRDRYLSARYLAADFDGRAAVEMARDLYWLLALGAALAARPVTPKAAAARQRAASKAAYLIAEGLRPRKVGAWWLVPSATRPGAVVHRVVDGVCDCEAGQNGRLCWHLEAVAQTVNPPALAAVAA